jgi:hypothetical protein
VRRNGVLAGVLTAAIQPAPSQAREVALFGVMTEPPSLAPVHVAWMP